MYPLHRRLVVLRGHTVLHVPQHLALVIQHDIARLEALHVALVGLRLRADEAAHRQCRGGSRVAAGAVRACDQLGLSAESDLACCLIPRGFPKVEPTMYMVVSSTIVVEGKEGLERDSVQVTGLSIGQSAVHARSTY